MRFVTTIGLAILAALTVAQGSSRPSLFQTSRPNLVIVATKSSLGPDNVEITSVDPGYPASLLQSQVEQLGAQIPSEIRGLMVQTYGSDRIRATFAVVGLIQRQNGILGLQPLCRSFSKGASGKPNTLMIQFASEAPSPRLLRSYENDGLQLEGQEDPHLGLEYRIKLLRTDPAQINIPEGKTARELAPKPAGKPSGSGLSVGLLAIIVVIAVAMGALVYSLLLRTRPKSASK